MTMWDTFKERYLCFPGRQTIFAMFFFMGCVYFNSVMQVIVQQSEPLLSGDLPDVGHDVLESLFPGNEAAGRNDIFTGISVVSAFIVTVTNDRDRVVSRRALFMNAILFLMRSISIYVTRVPNPNQACSSAVSGHFILEAVIVSFRLKKTCQDLIFSGHTCAILLASLVFCTYFPKYHLERYMSMYKANLVTLAVKGLNISCSIYALLTIISTKFHYTVDVYIAVLLTLTVWGYYHAKLDTIRLVSTMRYEPRGQTQRFMMWFENIKPEAKSLKDSESSGSVADDADLSTGDDVEVRIEAVSSKDSESNGGVIDVY